MSIERIPLQRRLAWLICYVTLAAAQPSVAEDLAQAPSPQAETETEVVQETGQQTDNPAPDKFDLWELRLKGNTLLDKKQLERTIYPFLGPQKSIENVELARVALEKLYQGQGYQTVTVDIPEQDVQNGVVYLQIVEGKISRLKVLDAHYFSLGKIKAGVPELAEGHVPHFPKMQQQLAELSGQSPDRQITPVLRAGEEPGTAEVDLKVQEKLPLHGRVELNNRYTQSTTDLRLVSSLHYDNLWQALHSASLMFQVSPENSDEVNVWAGTYTLPVFDNGDKLTFYAIDSSSNSQIADNGGLSIVGIGSIYGLRFAKALKAMGDYNHSATLGVDYKDFKQNVELISTDKSINTPISYLPFLAEYSGSYGTKNSMATFDLGLHFSVRGLGNKQSEFENKRYLAKADYMYATADLSFEQLLPWNMQWVSRFSGQLSDSPLISNEQFSLGGAEKGRGYYQTQILADNGVFGSMELYSPHLGLAEWEMVNNLKMLAFVDGGVGWIKDALEDKDGKVVSSYSLGSTGVGLRFELWKHLSGALDVGIPFIAQAPVRSGDPRIHFNIATEF